MDLQSHCNMFPISMTDRAACLSTGRLSLQAEVSVGVQRPQPEPLLELLQQTQGDVSKALLE